MSAKAAAIVAVLASAYTLLASLVVDLAWGAFAVTGASLLLLVSAFRMGRPGNGLDQMRPPDAVSVP